MKLHETVWNWAKALPDWQSDLLRRVLTSQVGGEHDDAILEQVVASAGGQPASTPPQRTQEADLPTSAGTGTVRLDALFDVEHVGLAEKAQRLAFAKDGITLIYGDNGAGKSTYSRILKAACRTRGTPLQVLPNVYEQESVIARPKARVTLELGGVGEEHVWSDASSPNQALKGVSVFDSESARHYIDERGKVAYQPPELDVLTRLAAEQDRLSKVLGTRLDALKNARPQFNELPAGTAARRWADGITGTTDIATLDALTALSADEEQHRQGLSKRLAELRQHDPKLLAAATRARAGRVWNAAAWLDDVHASVNDSAVLRWSALNARLSMAEAAVASFARKQEESRFCLGIGSETGTTLWAASTAFARYHGVESDHKADDAECPLCLQPLSEAARQRFAAFEEFVRGALQRTLEDVRTEIADAKKGLEAAIASREAPLEALAGLLAERPVLQQAVTECLVAASSRAKLLLAPPNVDAPPSLPLLPPTPGDALRTCAQELEQEALAFEQGAGAVPKEKLAAELAELDARISLAKRRDDALNAIGVARESALLQAAQRLLVTTGLTKKKTEWADAAVTESLRVALAAELKAFHLDHIPVRVASKGSKGETEHALELKDQKQRAKASQVLSEGEQRALGLAFFLAEVSAGSSDGPIVVDDPVSSLDHERREHVAVRLAEAGSARQVIVFTHDIVFALHLKDACEKRDVPVAERLVYRLNEASVGVLRDGLPWKASDLKRRRGVLAKELQAALALEGKDPDKYLFAVKHWFGLLRDCWEQSVEEKLFAGVVRRFGQGVQTLQLDRVRVTPDLIQTVEAGMTYASTFVHDAAAAKNLVPPTGDRLQAEMKTFDEFLAKFKD